jgi:hypothetical protein
MRRFVSKITLSGLSGVSRILLVLFLMEGALAAEKGLPAFGKLQTDSAGLIGVFYDLKQTQKRVPSGYRPDDYKKVIEEFLAKEWSESVLNRYFRSGKALYTSQIYIPVMSAGGAPKAFDLEKVVESSAWVVSYKAQVAPPEDGTYRFITFADDLLVVAVNGRTVCVGGKGKLSDLNGWRAKEGEPRIVAGNGELVIGDWVSLKKDEPVDLDILLGERPGGTFCAYVLYQKQGETYPVTEDGIPRFALFQLASHETPQPRGPRQGPPFSIAVPWRGIQ